MIPVLMLGFPKIIPKIIIPNNNTKDTALRVSFTKKYSSRPGFSILKAGCLDYVVLP
jgi:hypothetical protein